MGARYQVQENRIERTSFSFLFFLIRLYCLSPCNLDLNLNMHPYFTVKLKGLLVLLLMAHSGHSYAPIPEDMQVQHWLYVAAPGIRNYLEYGGHGLLVFDMDHDFRFIKRIPTGGLDENGQPSNVKGIAVSLYTHFIYISTIRSLICIDPLSEKKIWEKTFEGGCDRMSISPDGKIIYLPSFEGDDWKVVDAKTGGVLDHIVTHSGSHNTIYGLDGKKVYLEGLRSEYLTVVNEADRRIASRVGPFANHIRPFTIDSRQERCFVNVDGLLGFEIGDLKTGKKMAHIEVKGFQMGPVKRHGCPSHGIALTPNEREVWLADGFNESIHIFDISKGEIVQTASIKLSDQPGWITFSIDGKYAMPSTGDIIDVDKRKIMTKLVDETGTRVQSEKMVELVFEGNKLLKAGDQFGIGRAH
jgi:hypothetical protein